MIIATHKVVPLPKPHPLPLAASLSRGASTGKPRTLTRGLNRRTTAQRRTFALRLCPAL